MKTKICTILLIVTMIAGMCACSNKNSGSSGSPETDGSAVSESTDQVITDSSEPITANQLSISFFPYDVKEKIIENALCYTLTLKNSSPYPLLSTEIIYKTKETASDKALKQFNDFKNKHKKYVQQDEDNRNIVLIGRSEAYVKPSKSLNDVPVTIGIHSMTWYDSPNYDQFILMRPDTLSLGLVRDNLLYQCQYDFTDNTWTVDEHPSKLNSWPSTDLAELIPKPSASEFYQIKTKDEDNYFSFTAFGLSEADYENYVDAVRKAGFDRNKDKRKHSYSADDKKGNSIDILYDQSTWNMVVNVNL